MPVVESNFLFLNLFEHLLVIYIEEKLRLLLIQSHPAGKYRQSEVLFFRPFSLRVCCDHGGCDFLAKGSSGNTISINIIEIVEIWLEYHEFFFSIHLDHLVLLAQGSADQGLIKNEPLPWLGSGGLNQHFLSFFRLEVQIDILEVLKFVLQISFMNDFTLEPQIVFN
mmetsp:Transcript_23696/g.23394  ORF Transcript_23696/g.23394 Transcript_23696/m.23394 type:complete len:167 (-) Transcript_23696:538-1038(-)